MQYISDQTHCLDACTAQENRSLGPKASKVSHISKNETGNSTDIQDNVTGSKHGASPHGMCRLGTAKKATRDHAFVSACHNVEKKWMDMCESAPADKLALAEAGQQQTSDDGWLTSNNGSFSNDDGEGVVGDSIMPLREVTAAMAKGLDKSVKDRCHHEAIRQEVSAHTFDKAYSIGMVKFIKGRLCHEAIRGQLLRCPYIKGFVLPKACFAALIPSRNTGHGEGGMGSEGSKAQGNEHLY
eukprot:1159779-Pelagomonas_calceolata.AAC.6